MKIYEKTIRIVKDYIDMHNHVNNVVFLQLMQDIAFEHSSFVGQTQDMYKELNTTWFAKKNTITYNEPVILGDSIAIKTWIQSVGKTSALRKYEFVNTKTNKIVCEGETIWVYIDLKSRKPRRIDEKIISDFI